MKCVRRGRDRRARGPRATAQPPRRRTTRRASPRRASRSRAISRRGRARGRVVSRETTTTTTTTTDARRSSLRASSEISTHRRRRRLVRGVLLLRNRAAVRARRRLRWRVRDRRRRGRVLRVRGVTRRPPARRSRHRARSRLEKTKCVQPAAGSTRARACESFDATTRAREVRACCFARSKRSRGGVRRACVRSREVATRDAMPLARLSPFAQRQTTASPNEVCTPLGRAERFLESLDRKFPRVTNAD